VVRNGIADPCPGFTRPARSTPQEFNAIFIGLCSRDKGLFAAVAGVIEANRAAGPGNPPFRLTVAGAFPDEATEREFQVLASNAPGFIRHVGFVTGREKHELFTHADVLVFPTAYLAETQGLVVAVLTVLTLLFLTSLFEQLPEATLAAVVIAAVIELVDIGSLRRVYALYSTRLGSIYGKAARPDFIAATAAMLGVLIFDTLPGLVIGIIVSLLLLLYRASRPHVAELGQRVNAVRGCSGATAGCGGGSATGAAASTGSAGSSDSASEMRYSPRASKSWRGSLRPAVA
jgi:hypothetical protein